MRIPQRKLWAQVFIDVAYVVDSLRDLGVEDDRIFGTHLGRVADSACAVVEGDEAWIMHRAFFYDAEPEGTLSPGDEARQAWLLENDSKDDCHLRRGRLAGQRRRQKRVDVQIAVDALTAAAHARAQAFVFVTGDDDFSPLLEAMRDYGPSVGLAVFGGRSDSTDLRRAADRVGTLDMTPEGIRQWIPGEDDPDDET